MSRQMEESGLGFFVLPDDAKEHYGYHVGQRAVFFCTLLYKVALLCQKYKPGKSYKSYLSDTADIQIDRGVYAEDRVKIDAAHLCNTSFLSDLFLADANPKSLALTAYCWDLRVLSGATLPQTKYDNVGPDKVIDTFQTNFKNDYLHKLKTDPNFDNDPLVLWKAYVIGLNTALLQSSSSSFTNINSRGYAGAQAAQAKMASLANGGIDWALCEEFKKIAEAIAAL